MMTMMMISNYPIATIFVKKLIYVYKNRRTCNDWEVIDFEAVVTGFTDTS